MTDGQHTGARLRGDIVAECRAANQAIEQALVAKDGDGAIAMADVAARAVDGRQDRADRQLATTIQHLERAATKADAVRIEAQLRRSIELLRGIER